MFNLNSVYNIQLIYFVQNRISNGDLKSSNFCNVKSARGDNRYFVECMHSKLWEVNIKGRKGSVYIFITVAP